MRGGVGKCLETRARRGAKAVAVERAARKATRRGFQFAKAVRVPRTRQQEEH